MKGGEKMKVTVKTGNVAPVSGIYLCKSCTAKDDYHEITLKKDVKVPPCKKCGGCEFLLVRQTQH